jgi:hypothetical protein
MGKGFVSSQAGSTQLEAPPRLGEHTAEIKAWLAGTFPVR